MMRLTKRVFSAFLAFVMVFTMLPLDVWAQDGQSSNSVVAPMNVVKPDENKVDTYQFYVDGELKDTQYVMSGDDVYAPASPEKEGYKFTGWNTNVDGTGDAFTPGQKDDVTGKSYTYHAVFQQVYYVFFLNKDGVVCTTKEGVYGDSISTADVTFPMGTDEGIVGWYYDEDKTLPVQGDVVINGANVTLYPDVATGHWITYESDGGSYIAPIFVAPNAVTAEPTPPTRLGYEFKGWLDKSGLKFEFGKALTESVTLTADWQGQAVNYQVFYWKENADNDEYSLAESVEMSGIAGEQTRAGTDYNAGEGFHLSEKEDKKLEQKTIEGDGSTIVNVYYDRDVYTVTFHTGNGIGTLICDKEEHTHSRWSGCYNWRGQLTCTKEEHTHSVANGCYDTSTSGDIVITAKYGAYIGDQWPENDTAGSRWSTVPNGGSPWQSNIQTMPLNGDDFYEPSSGGDGTRTVYYYVEALDGQAGDVTVNRVNYVLHHRDVSQGSTSSTVSEEDRYALVGFTLISGSPSTGIGSKYNGAKFYYTRNDYKLTFVNGGIPSSETVQYEADISNYGTEPQRPTGVPENYTFQGWYLDEAGQTKFEFNGKKMPAYDITVYAKWAAPKVTATVHLTMAGTGDTEKVVVLYGETISEAELNQYKPKEIDFENEYTWHGWATKNGDIYTPFNFDTKLTQDITLYPYYTSNAVFEVVYDANGGSGTVTDAKEYKDYAYANVQSADALTAPAGKVFLGWNTAPDGSGETYLPGDKLLITEALADDNHIITLYAIWGDKAPTATLVYDANGGTGTNGNTVTENVANNKTVTLKTAENLGFTRDGYEFLGWSTSSDATEAEFKAGSSYIVNRTGTSDGVNTLYAVWKQVWHPGTQITVQVLLGGQNVKAQEYIALGNLDSGTQNFRPSFSGDYGYVNYDYQKLDCADITLTVKTIPTGYHVESVESDKLGPTTGGGESAELDIDGSGANWSLNNVPGGAMITVNLEPNTDTAYKVEHYQQNLDGEGYTLADTDNLTGMTGATVNAVAKNYAGFTHNPDADGAKEEGVIAGDGSLVLKVYYNRNTYNVVYKITGDYFANDNYKTVENVRYGASLTLINDTMEKDGYVWSEWSGLPETMPARDVEVTGSYEIRTDLSYTINYCWVGDTNSTIPGVESVTVENQTFNDKVTLSGEQLKTIQGYTLITNTYSTTIGVGENVINVLYYKNVTLEADSLLNVSYDGMTHEVKTYTVTGAGDETVTFNDITAYGSGELVGTYPVEFSVNGEKVDVTELVNKKDSTGRYCVTSAKEGTITITDEDVPDDKVVTKKDGQEDGYQYALGATVSYTITVKNIYNKPVDLVVSELSGVTIVNPDTIPETLTPGQEIPIQATYVIQEKDILKGFFTNKVTVTLDGNTFEGEETVTTVEPAPKLEVTKSITSTDVNKDNIYGLDETITYTITVKNTGNVTVTGINVADLVTVEGENRQAATVNTDAFDLKPGEDKSFEYTYKVQQSDLGKKILNTATATGSDPKGEDVIGTGTAEAETEKRNPELDVTKVAEKPANGTEYVLDETITYTITVKNTGNVTLKDIFVLDMFSRDGGTTWETQKDKLTPSADTLITLEPGEQKVYTYQYTVVEADLGKTLKNTATATAPNPDDPSQSVTDGSTTPGEKVEDRNPDLSVDKEVTSDPGADGVYDLGDTITYTITVRNEGNVTLTGVNVKDELLADGQKIHDLDLENGENITLAPKGHTGDSVTLTADYTVTEEDLGKKLKNTATATAEQTEPEDPDKPVEDKDQTDGEDTKDPTPDMIVDKTVVNGKASYQVGDVITYQITVSNTGNTTIHNVELMDVMQSANGKVTFTNLNGGRLVNGVPVLAELAPKTDWVVTCRYTVQMADADSDGTVISNKVTVDSDDGPNGEDPEDTTPGEPIDPIYTLTIKYQNGGRVDLRDPDTVKLHAGDVYNIVAPGINGYHLSDRNYAEFAYEMPNKDTTIVIIYARNPVVDDDDEDEEPVVNPDEEPEETTEETVDEVDPGVYIEDPEDYTLTPIEEDETPLAELDVGEHTCCIMHFLLMVAAMVVLGFYTKSKKKHQARIFELKKTLAMEKGKNPGGDNSQQS